MYFSAKRIDDIQCVLPETPMIVGEQDVHVWKCQYKEDGAGIERFRSVLSPDELRKAERFVYQPVGSLYYVQG